MSAFRDFRGEKFSKGDEEGASSEVGQKGRRCGILKDKCLDLASPPKQSLRQGLFRQVIYMGKY